MSLLSNSLFLDSEYKADCEYKINYLNIINGKNDVTSQTSESTNIDSDSDIDSKLELADVFNALETRIIRDQTSKPTFTDGQILYNTKLIGYDETNKGTYKILLEIDNSKLPENENV